MADIRLDGSFVNVEGVTKLVTADLMLDEPTRRTNATPFRRALVHDFVDGLTVSFNGDYPGGVTMRGAVSMPEGATVAGTDVAATLSALTGEIEELKTRPATLEVTA